MAAWTQHVSFDPAFFRPAEVIDIVADSTEAREALGWSAKVTFTDIVAMMVEAHRCEQQATAR